MPLILAHKNFLYIARGYCHLWRMFKAVLLGVLLVAATAVAQTSPDSPPPSPPPMQAELLRSTTARTLGPNGLANGTIPLKKGMLFPVLMQKLGFVVLDVNGGRVALDAKEVTITPRPEGAGAPPPGTPAPAFTPGQIVLISAKYTLEGNQPRNVKNRLAKLIPAGVITAPVSILVTDGLSSAAQAQDGLATVTGTSDSSTVQVQLTARNILTVQYSFNGQVRTKQAAEGTQLVLP
jgi:hypothetical protein